MGSGRGRLCVILAMGCSLIAAAVSLFVLVPDVGLVLSTASPVPKWGLVWRTAGQPSVSAGQDNDSHQQDMQQAPESDANGDPIKRLEAVSPDVQARKYFGQGTEAGAASSPIMPPSSSVSQRRRALARDCSIAFVAAITSPADGKLSPRTMEFTEFMFLSALSKHYSACAVVLTNTAGNFNFLQGRIDGLEEVVYDDFWGTPKTYMYDRTRAYVRFLSEEAQSPTPRNLIFSDTDILYIKSLADVFDAPFDVALTYRNMPKYPINNGIMFAHKDRLQEASNFWAKIVSIYEQQQYDRGWQGDQYAVCKFMEAAGKYFTGKKHYRKQVAGVDVKLLHISGFNFPPRSGCKIGSQVRVLHFKGDEKSKLPQAAKILRRGRGQKSLDDISWLNAPKSMKARGRLKNCQDS